MFRASRSGDDASSRVLNSLQLVEIRGRRAMKHGVAVVESPVDSLHLRDVAMASTFWLLMGYNFSCLIASGTIFNSGGEFSGLCYTMKT